MLLVLLLRMALQVLQVLPLVLVLQVLMVMLKIGILGFRGLIAAFKYEQYSCSVDGMRLHTASLWTREPGAGKVRVKCDARSPGSISR